MVNTKIINQGIGCLENQSFTAACGGKNILYEVDYGTL
jgi:hypothetical protein